MSETSNETASALTPTLVEAKTSYCPTYDRRQTAGKVFTVLLYNQCYALNAGNPWTYLMGHLEHNRGQPDKTRRRADIRPTIQLVEQQNPDVLALLEVLGDQQRTQIDAALRAMGYDYIHVGQGRAIGNSGEQDLIVLATKTPSSSVELPTVQTLGRLGEGGGIVGAHIPELGCTVTPAHFAFSSKPYQKKVREGANSTRTGMHACSARCWRSDTYTW